MSTTKIIGNITGSVAIDINNDIIGSGNNNQHQPTNHRENNESPHNQPRWSNAREWGRRVAQCFLWIIVIGLSIAVINIYCCDMRFDGNSAGVVISALGVLVALLVGWQIYNTIGLDRRMRSAEIDIKRMSDELIVEKRNAQRAVQMSIEYGQGVSCLATAMIQYYEFIRRRDSDIAEHTDNRHEELKQFISAYIISERAIAHFLNANLEEVDFPFDLVDMCLQSIDLNWRELSNSHYLPFFGSMFSDSDHSACDGYYETILQNAAILGGERIGRLTDYRNRRTNLRNVTRQRF